MSASNEWQFTFVEESSISFVIRGKNLCRTLVNIPKMSYDTSDDDPHKWKLVSGERTFLQKKFGVFRVSLLWPVLGRLHRFKIDSSRLIAESLRSETPLKQWIQKAGGEKRGLLWKFPQPFLFEGIELKGNFHVDILVYALFEVVNPYIPVFIYRGKFFQQLAAAIEGVVAEAANNLTYEMFVKKNKGMGSSFAKGEIVAKLDALEEKFGIKMEDAWIMSFQLAEEDDDIIKATKALDKETLLAAAAKQRGKGKADETEASLFGEEKRFGRLVKALTDHDVDPNVAAEVVKQQLRMERVAGPDSKITTFVEGGSGGAVVAIPPKP